MNHAHRPPDAEREPLARLLLGAAVLVLVFILLFVLLPLLWPPVVAA